jgi:DNA repair exonuclease SbcCD ATPase subunit
VAGVGQSLKPGKAAVVAEVWEDWTLPVDTKMESLGGVVFRRARRDSLDLQVEWDITALKAQIDELETEHAHASGEFRTKLQEKIDTVRAKLQTTVSRIQVRLESSQQETKAKIDSLQDQAAKARDERKAKLEKRITELQAEQKRRNEQLMQTRQHIKETLKA